MQKSITASVLSAAFLVGCAGMNGAETASNTACDAGLDAQDGYVGAKSGKVIMSGSKGIVHTGDWSEDKIFAPCEGGESKTAEIDLDAKKAAEEAAAAEAALAEEAAAAAAALAAAEQHKEPVSKPIKIEARVLFSTSNTELSASGISAIEQLVQAIEELSEVNRVVVIGHTDSKGSEAYNQKASEKRAQIVRDLLASKLPDLDIAAIGRGEMRPIADNNTALGRAKNRRAEIVVIGSKKEMHN